MRNPTYVLDADTFMQAARLYYAFDIAPPFWHALIQHAQTGTVLSIDRVKTEIDRGNDNLKNWAKSHFHSWFASTDESDVIDAYRRVMQWAYGQTQFDDAAKAEFASTDNADAWLVAYALAKGCVLVTQEQFARDARNRIPLPNVCQAFGVHPVNTFEMLRTLGVRFK
ncbi:MAG: twitching motility protein PilT [Planctomycetes bacterium GWA2_50_13]|nr:MAG: twitching motility protein PilT [Planctomycetes bacterium GWA2_50_13]OHB96348.1 MAG: twitching motility protein PilT [Planctomycetes bacterium RIFCSPLOWO2_02_FULL_50_16]OHC04571.1 MAG: twitching motility protein PilT [Planctomycetes bacterium RIFCSPLOWO2_12_FULL_50_35]